MQTQANEAGERKGSPPGLPVQGSSFKERLARFALRLRDYLKTWRGTQPVIPAKAGIYGLWSAMPVYQEGQLILRQFLSLAAYLPGLDGQPSYRVAPVMGCRIQSRAVTAVDASVGVDETFGLRPVVKVVAAWRAGDAGAALAVGLAAGVAGVEHNGAGLGDIQAAGPECRVVRRSRHAVPRRPGTRSGPASRQIYQYGESDSTRDAVAL